MWLPADIYSHDGLEYAFEMYDETVRIHYEIIDIEVCIVLTIVSIKS